MCLQARILSWNIFPSLKPSNTLERHPFITTQFTDVMTEFDCILKCSSTFLLGSDFNTKDHWILVVVAVNIIRNLQALVWTFLSRWKRHMSLTYRSQTRWIIYLMYFGLSWLSGTSRTEVSPDISVLSYN